MATLVVGLGNPGGEYRHTRHNAGWMVLDELVRRGRFGGEKRDGSAKTRTGAIDGYDVVLAWPQTYMNLSGKAGQQLVSQFGVLPADLIVVHDDVDLPFARLRLRRGGSAGGQKGVDSLIQSLGTKEFIRIRVGVGRPPEGRDTADHVLDRFSRTEQQKLDQAISRAADSVMAVVQRGLDAAMNEYNRDPETKGE